MKKILNLLICFLFLTLLTSRIHGNDTMPGYSEWTTKISKKENEISAVQYGRKVALEWSDWSIVKPTKQDVKQREGIKNYYVSQGENEAVIKNDANSKLIYGWTFSETRRITYFYIDVDTYNSANNSNYEGPPLQLYCDGVLWTSIGKHDATSNWSSATDKSCQYVDLYMSSNNDNGRNTTKLSSSYLSIPIKEYSYVSKWSTGQDWRFDEKYTRIKGGDNPQQPVERKVYCYPLTYNIYYELNGGSSNDEFIYTYTVLDEVNIPSVSKIGYDFLGFYNSEDIKIEKINIGTYGDIYLNARFKRKDPSLSVGFAFFRVDEKTKNISVKEVIDKTNAKAIDELEGDISDKIIIEKIEYEYKGKIVNNPDYLEIDKTDFVNILFSITNNEGCTVKLEKKFPILGKGSIIKDYKDNIKIYSRYISKEYYETLEENSIWRSNEYKNTLSSVFS